MLLVIGGVIDFGRALYSQVILTNAAREGARALVVLPADQASQATSRVTAAAGGLDLPSLLPPTLTGCQPGPQATVVLTYKFKWMLLEPAMNLVKLGNLLPEKLSSQAVMQCGG